MELQAAEPSGFLAGFLHPGVVNPAAVRLASFLFDMSYSLNSLKGGYMGDYIGDYYRGY